jgi:hypothetical protein
MAVSLSRPIKLPQEVVAAASANVISILPVLEEQQWNRWLQEMQTSTKFQWQDFFAERLEGLVENVQPIRPLPPYKPAERDASTPANLVDVPSVTKTAALTVLLVCIFSLITQALTGFTAIHPFVSVLLIGASIMFYIMGKILSRDVR